MNANSDKKNYRVNQVSSQTPPVCTVSNLIGFFIGANMEKIPLTQGQFTSVDDKVCASFAEHKWFASKERGRFYAKRHSSSPNRRTIAMHRVVIGAKDGQIVDHIDGDSLNNQRHNLRICTSQQNTMNGKPRGGTSKFKGVLLYKATGRWQSRITYNYEVYHLGYFKSEVKAAEAYDKAACEFFGNFARLNFALEPVT